MTSSVHRDAQPHEVGTNTCDIVRQAFAESPSVIRIRNLQHTTNGPSDAWGQRGRAQPLLLSAGAYLRDTFGSSAEEDAVKADTIHYGVLSKFFLERLKSQEIDSLSLNSLAIALWTVTTGWEQLREHVWSSGVTPPFLDVDRLLGLELTVSLPKASLLGEGVGITLTGSFEGNKLEMIGKAVQVTGLRVPTLIGVNPNERLARQIVVANITVEDMWDGPEIDYVGLEAKVVETMTTSSRETLEALAEDLSIAIGTFLSTQGSGDQRNNMWYLTIALDKPTAVPLAGTACVELRVNTREISYR